MTGNELGLVAFAIISAVGFVAWFRRERKALT